MSPGFTRASMSVTLPMGTISMIGAPGPMTPPSVLLRMFFTSPRTGDLITVRLRTSWRPACCSSICARSVCSLASSVLASWRKRFTRSEICRLMSLIWRRRCNTSTSDSSPFCDIISDITSSRPSISTPRWLELTASSSARLRAMKESRSLSATCGAASTSGGNTGERPTDSAVRRAICAFSAIRLVSPSACCDW